MGNRIWGKLTTKTKTKTKRNRKDGIIFFWGEGANKHLLYEKTVTSSRKRQHPVMKLQQQQKATWRPPQPSTGFGGHMQHKPQKWKTKQNVYPSVYNTKDQTSYESKN
jgi:hypothetical protein